MSAVIDYLRSHREESLGQFIDYLKIPSISTLGTGVHEAAEHLVGLMEGAGVKAQILPTKGFPVVYGEAEGPSGAPTLLIYGHYDVQPADAAEGWTSEPFEPEVRDGRVFARGAGDNKAQHFAHIKTMEAYGKTGTPLPVNVKLLVEGEEEMGSTNLQAFIQENKDLLQADVACSSDGSLHPSDRPTFVLGCRGILYVELHCRGTGKDLHSGLYGGAVQSPFWRLLEAIQAIRGPDGRVRIPGYYEAVQPLGAEDEKFLAEIPSPEAELRAALGEGADRIPDISNFYRNVLPVPNLNICGFMGGYSGQGMKTVTPGGAAVKMDFRLVVNQDPNQIFEDLCRFLEAEGFSDIEARKLAIFPPSKTGAENPFLQKIISAVAAKGDPPVIYPNSGGSVPDYYFTKDLGIPSMWLPMANADTNSHAPDENMRIDLLHRGSEVAVAVLEGVA